LSIGKFFEIKDIEKEQFKAFFYMLLKIFLKKFKKESMMKESVISLMKRKAEEVTCEGSEEDKLRKIPKLD